MNSNTVHTTMSRKQEDIKIVSTEADAIKLIREFLIARNLPIKEISGNDSNFQIHTTNPGGINYNIIQPKSVKRIVLVATKPQFHNFHVEILKSMPEAARDNLLWELKEKFVFVPPSFQLDNPTLPSSIQFVQEITYDELTEGTLSKAFICIARCVVWVSWVFNRGLGVPPE